MKPVSLLRLALAGSRTDTLRVVLTAFSAALAMVVILAAATVIAIPDLGTPMGGSAGWNQQYSSAYLREPGLRPGVTTAIVLLVIPCLVLAAQCGRLGAPARDRRLASVRLAGATPRQAVKLVATETGIASALGAAAGLGIFLAARTALHSPDAEGHLPLPTDVRLSGLVLAVLALSLPLLATLASVVALRRVTVGPFGVVRRERTGRPRVWPGFLIVPGVALVALLEPITRYAREHGTPLPDAFFLVAVGVGSLLTIVGVVFGTGWISYATGRVLVRYARRASAVLAGRRLIADPWAGSRAFAVVLTCVVFAAGAAGTKAAFTADFAAQDADNRRMNEGNGGIVTEPTDRSFYYDAFDLINTAVLVAAVIAAGGLLVTIAEGIVSRRRTYAHLAASGVPRTAMSKAVMWQSIAPLVPATLMALIAGTALPRALFGTEYRSDGDSATTIVPVETPFGELAMFGAIAVLVVGAAVGVGLLFLRPSTHPAELRTG